MEVDLDKKAADLLTLIANSLYDRREKMWRDPMSHTAVILDNGIFSIHEIECVSGWLSEFKKEVEQG